MLHFFFVKKKKRPVEIRLVLTTLAAVESIIQNSAESNLQKIEVTKIVKPLIVRSTSNTAEFMALFRDSVITGRFSKETLATRGFLL